MAISLGPKLGLLYNSNIDEEYYDALRLFLQSIDQLIMGSVINATTVVPPTTPSPGDSYLLTGGTPSGAWTGQAGNIAVWNAQLTNSGTNTVVPGWIFLVPKPGWTLWNVATASYSVFNGTAWTSVSAGGADFPVNTDITQLTGLSHSAGTAIAISGGTDSNFAISVTDGVHTSTWSSNGQLSVSSIASSGSVICGGITSSAAVASNAFQNATPGTSMSFATAGTAGYTATFNSGIQLTANSSGGNWDLELVSWPTDTTATAGGASALPATPAEYIFLTVNGNRRKIATYAV